MKTIFMFSTLLILILSCASNIKAKYNYEEEDHSLYSAASPQINFKLDELPPDEHIEVMAAENIIGFCHECAYHCMRRRRRLGECRSFVCHCTIGGWSP
ncbi:hypothetical protein CARUB_v10028010mg [Capsella rubella]|uniref:Invertebrate defensins family profile domain-containing protein n=1 Tax=Capsella rubella TaxID=81985 RepID=R0GDD9_9BRAS|nr:defensin-like protein 222 [Capsella rubella]EOA14724.1 hypothetical protein CARUB_v10028010mg [Capsella rubella]